MKFVVTGAVEPAARISSRCSTIAARISSELKRRKSIFWAGLCRYWVVRGGVISSQSPYPWDQNAVVHSRFSTSRVP